MDGVNDHLALAIASSILADLCEQEWRIRCEAGKIFIAPPDWTLNSGHTAEQIKSRVRNGLQIASDRQIASKSVQEFLKSMERHRAFNGRAVSIGSLVDDGELLAKDLRSVMPLRLSEHLHKVKNIFDPYVQVCDEASECEYTGLKLLDVWRYFRHTWSLEYNPLPGRTLRLIVRNRARPNSPVIGIAMLASPSANMYIRDAWIGWRIDDLIQGLAKDELDAGFVGKYLWSTLREAITEIRSDDLICESELSNPTPETLFKLRQMAGLAHGRRRSDLSNFNDVEAQVDNLVDIRAFAKKSLQEDDWRLLSETPLFVKKRAEQLIPLLKAHSFMKAKDFAGNPAAAMYESLVTKEGRAIIGFVLGELRKQKLATEVADLAVCGAIEPYNHLLGGKLVTMLMATEEVQALYRQRYSAQVSEIASQMAGRPIVRKSNLHAITTTSLYGISSSQYNRLKVRILGKNGRNKIVKWEKIGVTEGVTITHLSRRTTDLMQQLSLERYGARRINSVFGEGSSPRTRQIREGLNLIGINNDAVLKQSLGRQVYACELVSGSRDALTGFKPHKAVKGISAKVMSDAWIRRWLLPRILKPEVLEEVRVSGQDRVAASFRERARRGAISDQGPLSNGLVLDFLNGLKRG